jgi:hypothetical protein
MKGRLEQARELGRSIETGGVSGLVRTVARMIGEDQPNIDCLTEADNCFGAAADGDQVWDCVLDMAGCLRNSILDPEPPEVEPPEPPDEPPEPPEPPQPGTRPGVDSAADVVLAAFLLNLWERGPRSDSKTQSDNYSLREDF